MKGQLKTLKRTKTDLIKSIWFTGSINEAWSIFNKLVNDQLKTNKRTRIIRNGIFWFIIEMDEFWNKFTKSNEN